MKVQLLIQLEKTGLEALKEGNYKEAISCFKKIINIHPNYEHGSCFYDLACAYEDIGKLDLAKENYEKALEYRPDDKIFLGGYASFLYLHGPPIEAFNAYIKIFRLENNLGGPTDDLVIALKNLGRKINLSEDMIEEKIKRREYI